MVHISSKKYTIVVGDMVLYLYMYPPLSILPEHALTFTPPYYFSLTNIKNLGALWCSVIDIFTRNLVYQVLIS